MGKKLRQDPEELVEAPPPGSTSRDDGVGATDAEHAGEALTQVRELLFGPPLRLRDEAIGELQSTLERQSEELRQEVRQQLTSLERTLKSELQGMSERLQLQERDRKAIAEDLLGVQQKLSRSVEQSEEKARQGHSELRDQLRAHAKLLEDTIQQRHEEALRRLDEALGEVETTKTDRATLSALLVDVAERLKGGGNERADH